MNKDCIVDVTYDLGLSYKQADINDLMSYLFQNDIEQQIIVIYFNQQRAKNFLKCFFKFLINFFI